MKTLYETLAGLDLSLTQAVAQIPSQGLLRSAAGGGYAQLPQPVFGLQRLI